jgi:hypothetical protein
MLARPPFGGYLRAAHREALGLDEFLTLGVDRPIIRRGFALPRLPSPRGFCRRALAMRRIEADRSSNRTAEPVRAPKQAPHPHVVSPEPEHAGRHMAQAVLHFNEQLERIGEVGVVVMIGAMLSWELLMPEALLFFLCYSSLSGRCRLNSPCSAPP